MNILAQLLPETVQAFRVATARAITRLCETMECVLVSVEGEDSQSGVTVQPQNVAIPNNMISNNSDSRPVLSFYVQLNNSIYISSSVLTMAVEVSTSI